MPHNIEPGDCVGLLRPGIDSHTLGLDHVSQLLEECGVRVVVADSIITDAVNRISELEDARTVHRWITDNRMAHLGFSYRLDPAEARDHFGRFYHQLRDSRLLAEHGGPIKGLYFAGLPEACRAIEQDYGDRVRVFSGAETPRETLLRLGVPPRLMPHEVRDASEYDDARMQFGRHIVARGDYLGIRPVDRAGYPGYGRAEDHVVSRLDHSARNRLPPLIRAHVGPYQTQRQEAIALFLDWTRQLAQAGYLDILSIGTSQLTQSRFGDDWEGLPNGGGVPINSPAEYRRVWEAARPMLVRTYAGTRNIRELARIYEETTHIAWHALSFWWFCKIDGRGPNTVYQNLREHLDTLRFAAQTNKPFEPNIPHHFAFRGGDDITYVLSAYLAAKTAKLSGVRFLILQIMLNTPKSTWGVQDLAKARALLRLVRDMEDQRFRVILQPRAGLELFSADPEEAKVQLAAATALMADIEPGISDSPEIVHVVSYSEGSRLADPAVINESIQITRKSLEEYPVWQQKGWAPEMTDNAEVNARTDELCSDVRTVLAAIEQSIPEPYTPEGLYRTFAAGFLPAPYLWECRKEFKYASQWPTSLVNGGVKTVDSKGRVVSAQARADTAAQRAGKIKVPVSLKAD